MASICTKMIILSLIITLLFLGALISADPNSTICEISSAVSIYSRSDEYLHQNASFETLDALFGYADPLRLWRFSPTPHPVGEDVSADSSLDTNSPATSSLVRLFESTKR